MSVKSLAFQYEPSIEISEGLWYCEKKELYWKGGTTYCPLSAAHNGLIGSGAALKHTIGEYNETTNCKSCRD